MEKMRHCKLTHPRLPNHKTFNPENENEREAYFYSIILLFVPFRDESLLLLENETAEEAFNRLLPTNVNCSAYHEKLQKILQAQSNVKKINIARQTDSKEQNSNTEDDSLQLIGEAKTAMQEVLNMNVNSYGTLTLHDRVDMLNRYQARVYLMVKNHLNPSSAAWAEAIIHRSARDGSVAK